MARQSEAVPQSAVTVPAPTPRLIGLVMAASISALLWGLIAEACAAAFGLHLAHTSIALAVAPIAVFLAFVLAPIMLRPAPPDEDAVDHDAIADETAMALTSLHANLTPVIRRRRASSA